MSETEATQDFKLIEEQIDLFVFFQLVLLLHNTVYSKCNLYFSELNYLFKTFQFSFSITTTARRINAGFTNTDIFTG